MKEVLFVAFSDIHLHDWPQYSVGKNRLHDGGLILSRVNHLCNKYGVSALCMGDLIHNPTAIDNRLLNLTYDWFNDFKERIYCISGNHDQCEKNTWDNYSINYLTYFSKVHKHIISMDHKRDRVRNIDLYGIPYMVDTESFLKSIPKPESKRSILMIHQNLPGAKEPNGYEVESGMPRELYKKFKGFGLVLSGHVHKPQRIFSNTYMLGATNQQRISDMGCKMGCWLIYNDLTMKFVSLGIREFRMGNDYRVNKGHMHIPEVEKMEEEKVTGDYNPNNTELDIAKEYLKTKNIKSKAKEKILIKYLRK